MKKNKASDISYEWNFPFFSENFHPKNDLDEDNFSDLTFLHGYEYARECSFKDINKSKWVNVFDKSELNSFKDRFNYIWNSYEDNYCNAKAIPPFYFLWPEFPKEPYLKSDRKERLSRNKKYLLMLELYRGKCSSIEILSPHEIIYITTEIKKPDEFPKNVISFKLNRHISKNKFEKEIWEIVSRKLKELRLKKITYNPDDAKDRLDQLKQLSALRIKRHVKEITMKSFVQESPIGSRIWGKSEHSFSRDRIKANNNIQLFSKNLFFYEEKKNLLEVFNEKIN